MEDQEAAAMNRKCPRKLDFNAPLLSTRRASGLISAEMSRTDSLGTSRGICDMVPFLWELAPGKPKHSKSSDTHDMVVPPPKLPPGWWHNRPKEALQADDDGCDGDIDDDDDDEDDVVDVDNDNDDAFSDAMDIFSLADSIDIVDKAEKVNGFGGTVNLEIEAEYSGNQSPNFMLGRFLPDATALAASSAMNRRLPNPSNLHQEAYYVSRGVSASYSSPKGCGLGFDMFFPWRMKHKPCGIKSPVRQMCSNVKPQWSTRKKQN